jgi:ADP-heptose:LPS heptosyltransferase
MLPRNILIFHAGALGDFIQTWPLGLALGRLFPQSRVIYITQRQKGLLAEKLLSLESLDIETGWHNLFGDPSKLPDTCRSKLAAAHIIVTFLAKLGDPWLSAVSTIVPKAQLIPLPPGPAQQIHDSLAISPIIQTAVTQIMTSISQRGIIRSGIATHRPPDPAPIAIHPGSGSQEKCWPLDSYLTLIDRFRAAGKECKILLGEVELERFMPDQIRRLESAAPTVRPRTYLDLAAELSSSSASIGNDTGPSHLAAILGLPTLVLFGPTNPQTWKPLGPRVTTLHREPIDSIDIDELLEAANKNLFSHG